MQLCSHKSDESRLLEHLKEHSGEWCGDLYGKFGVVHSRISGLREKGCVIESKCFGRKPNGRPDYRYRLIEARG